ncbi:Asp-tRNA(Asn)/Glu-tRNA(Gln) amidotransferase subunit GatC [Sporosarcina sp. CAU 1771]
MTVITNEEMKIVAYKAHLTISDEEAESYAQHLSGIISLADALTDLNTEGVTPMTHGLELINVMREDVPSDVLDRDEMLLNVKEHKDGQILVPSIL